MDDERTRVAAALRHIPAEDYETWWRVGLALWRGLGEAGRPLWDGWAQTSDRYDERAQAYQWRYFGRRQGPISLGTLFHMAREHGWDGDAKCNTMLHMPVTPSQDWAVEQDRRVRAGAARAQALLAECVPDKHAYLKAKGFPDRQGLTHRGSLVIPAHGPQGLQSVQFIHADGAKRFLAGAVMRGACHRLGRGRECWVVEGYATGLSVQAALRQLHRDAEVRVAFSAANMLSVQPRAGTRVAVVADHDRHGVGEEYARRMDRPYWLPPQAGDANDYHMAAGLPALVACLRDFIRSLEAR